MTLALDAEARFFTASAKDWGKSRLGGVLTRSRAQSRALPTTSARRTASRTALPWPAPETTVMRGPADGAFPLPPRRPVRPDSRSGAALS